MNNQTIKQAFYTSIPVMAGYVVLGTGFGILMRNAGYGVLWAASMSVLIFAGSMQYVGVGLLAGGASVLTTVITTIMVNARHLFYSISMIDKYKNAGKYKPSVHPFGIPELIAVTCVAGVQVWKRNSLISILTGTVIYMVLVQMVF